jgi:acetyl-CoA acetyltransferase
VIVEVLERMAIISGIGQSAVGRGLGRSGLDLTAEAARQAIADAGLTAAEVDGISCYPGGGIGPPGFAGPDVDAVQDALGLRVGWHDSGSGGPGQLGAVLAAAPASNAGGPDRAAPPTPPA